MLLFIKRILHSQTLFVTFVCILWFTLAFYLNQSLEKAYQDKVLGSIKLLAQNRYIKRRTLIQDFCEHNMNNDFYELIEVNQDPKWNDDLWFDTEHQLLYCQISKVGSVTWVDHLMQ